MHSLSSCDCYCKTREPTYPRRKGTQSDRSRVKLVTSKTSVCKTDTSRSGRNVPLTPAKPVSDGQLDGKRSATIPATISPVLSPETSAALENVDRLVKDAQIQIKAINIASDCNGFQTPVKTYSAEVSIDDENDQLLYVRERVAWKFQEANGWSDATNYRNPETVGLPSYERKVPVIPKKITDFTAPKFKMLEERRKEFECRGPFAVIQQPGISAVDTRSIERANGPDQIPCPRLKTFTCQTCPTVNIERQLTAQNLQSIHISPDPTFVQENANVGTYVVSHGRGTKSQARKEKFVKIFEEHNLTNGKRSSENQRKKHGRGTNDVKNSAESSRGSVSSAEISRTSSLGTCSANVGNGTEDARKRDGEERASIAGGNNEDFDSVATEDVRAASLDDHRKSKDREEVRDEIERFEERATVDGAAKDAATVKTDHKQVRFSEEVPETIAKPSSEARNDEENCKSVESKDVSVSGHNFDRLGDLSTAEGIKIRERFSSTCQLEDEDEYERTRKKVHDEKNRERERYEIVEQNFASLRRKYCDQNDESVEDPDLPESSNVETSGDGSDGSADEQEFYHPAIEELDDVLLSYKKIIDEASRSIRTIDKYLTRPELEEFLEKDAASRSTESPKPIRSHRSNAGMPRRKSARDQTAVKHKPMNETRRSCGTMTRAKGARSVKLQSARFNKPDYHSGKKNREPPENSIDVPLRDHTKFLRRTDTDSRISSNTETELRETDSDKIAKHIEKTLARFFQVERSRDATAFRAEDESSSFTVSPVNPSLASTGTRSVRANKLEATSRLFGDDVVEKDSSPLSNATIVRDIEQKQTKTKPGFPDKINNGLDLEAMMPILVKNLLTNFQNGATGSPDNFELLITENIPVNNVDANVHEMGTTACLKTDDQSEKECSKTGIRTDAKEIITEENAGNESIRENVNTEFLDKPASRSSNSEEVRSKQENSAVEPNQMNSNVESLREALSINSSSTSNRKMENIDRKSFEYLELKGNNNNNNNNGSSASTRNVSSIGVARRMETDENRTDEKVQCNVLLLENEDIASGAMNDLSARNKGTANGMRPKNSVNEDFSSKPGPRMENEKIEMCLDPNEIKVPVEYNDSTRRTSSSDSLRDCVSLEASPRNEPKLLKIVESTSKINEIDQLMKTNDAVNGISNRIFNENHPHVHTFEKEKILSDLYDEIHDQLLRSTLTTNHSTLVQRNTSTLEDMPATVSHTIESVSLDTSRSEGELFVPSSGSCSLGEIKMLNTNEQDNIITVFVTKETLSLWSESSKSLVRSIGEI